MIFIQNIGINSLINEMEQDYKGLGINMSDLKNSVKEANGALTSGIKAVEEFEDTIDGVKSQLDAYNVEKLFNDAIQSIRDILESRKYII